tara:strand:- start:6143 stop:6637 length:495 start_codon:yes stop_codon:yes gene_type:complete
MMDANKIHIHKYYTEQELLAEVRKSKKLIDIFNLKCVAINTKYVNSREKMNRKMISIQYEVLDLYLGKLFKKMSIIKSIINGLVTTKIPLFVDRRDIPLPFTLQLLKYFETRQLFMNNGKFKSTKDKIKFNYTFYENAYRFTRGKARNYYKRTKESPYEFVRLK